MIDTIESVKTFDKANCLGFALGRNEWLEFPESVYSNKKIEDIDKTLGGYCRSKSLLCECLAESIANYMHWNSELGEFRYYGDITAETAPIGAIAMMVGFCGFFQFDFHFMVKTTYCGEVCWLHKPGQTAIDIMFDEDIENYGKKAQWYEWSKPRFLVPHKEG